MSIRKVIDFKLDEFRYALKTSNVAAFIFSNMLKKQRIKFYEMYHNRGASEAIALGINIPSGFPIGSLDEVFLKRFTTWRALYQKQPILLLI